MFNIQRLFCKHEYVEIRRRECIFESGAFRNTIAILYQCKKCNKLKVIRKKY